VARHDGIDSAPRAVRMRARLLSQARVISFAAALASAARETC
jgi:hypothetical protein